MRTYPPCRVLKAPYYPCQWWLVNPTHKVCPLQIEHSRHTEVYHTNVPPGGLPIGASRIRRNAICTSHLPGSHLYTGWVERSNQDKVSCPRTQPRWPQQDSNLQSSDLKPRVLSTWPSHLYDMSHIFFCEETTFKHDVRFFDESGLTTQSTHRPLDQSLRTWEAHQ